MVLILTLLSSEMIYLNELSLKRDANVILGSVPAKQFLG